MKIGVLITISNGFGKKGFYHSQEVGLGKFLESRGHEVIIYKCVPTNKPAEEMVMRDELRIRYIPSRSLGVHGYLPSRKLDKDLDVLFSFADTQLFLPHIIKFCKKHDICFIPYVGIGHSAQRNLKSKIFDAAFAAGTLRHYKGMTIVAKTPAVQKEFLDLGVEDCRIAPVGLDKSSLKLDFRDYNRNKLREEFGFGEHDVIISFVGRLQSEKRPMDCLRIFKHVYDEHPYCSYKLLIVGDGYERPNMENLITKWGMHHSIKIIDRVPNADIWKVHYISDYLINLCRREIFGMAIMEGIMYESAVAAVHAPGPDAIIPGMEGHALFDDDREIEKWLAVPIADRDALRRSSDKLLEKYSWATCADVIEEIYDAYRDARDKGEDPAAAQYGQESDAAGQGDSASINSQEDLGGQADASASDDAGAQTEANILTD